MMTTEDWRDSLGDGLVVTLDLPVSASDRPATSGDAAAHLLDAIAVLEDGHQGLSKEDAPAELQRLELKIDLLTDLVSSLLSDKVPKPLTLSISSEGVVLPAASLPSGCACIQLYPSQWLAQPLILEIGEVQCRGDLCGALWRSRDPGLRDALARWVFRMHRRDVARRRRGYGPWASG